MLSLISLYLLLGIGYYAYAVLKSYETTGCWAFKLKDGYVGLCKYPRGLLCWMELIFKKD
jgi:hypothetical protein